MFCTRPPVAPQLYYDRPVEFRGTQRYEVKERLGRGGMGVVYRAFDRELGVEVALKTLHQLDPRSLLRFKNEFRSLADVSHPNLVSLHEMVSVDDQWFFTMELIDGVDFLTHVRGFGGPDPLSSATTMSGTDPGSSASLTTVSDAPGADHAQQDPTEISEAPPAPPADIAILRDAMRQLAEGVHALHRSGHLHRDIKPSNVMVTGDGRVMLLDFGIVAPRSGSTQTGDFAGTPLYMAPEQARKDGATEASDWYSVGVILFQCLTGRLPFTGPNEAVIMKKQVAAAPAPRHLEPNTPRDLDELCTQLLATEASDRPSERSVLSALGSSAGAAGDTERRVSLFGRDAHLSVLRAAADRARRECVALFVHGRSGMGKTELVHQFLRECDDENTIVLRGRCFEKESVPFKAVDSSIDSLCRHLSALDGEVAERLVPPDARMLVQMFPVLGRVDAFSEHDSVDTGLIEPQELRRRACAALRELLARMAEDHRLVLFIDDLQWGDDDSAPVLEALIRPPDAPPLLLLGSYRTDEEDRSGLLRALFRPHSELDPGSSVQKLEVGPLDDEDAEALARSLVFGTSADNLAPAIARESGGNPFFLTELAHFSRDRENLESPSLAELIRSRVAALEDPVRRLVEVAAVTARPIEQRIVKAAAEIGDAEWAQTVQRARASRLIRLSGARSDDLIECYHDRIRETLSASLSLGELGSYHRRIAAALEDSSRRDPEILAEHLMAAGDTARASEYIVQAAELAEQTLAFDRVARLYRLALDLGTPNRAHIQERLALALVNAGRGSEGARVYQTAANQVDGGRALDLRRHAAEQYLRSGYVDEGQKVLAEVLREQGLSMPSSPLRAVPSILWQRLKLRLRGLSYRPRRLGELDDEERRYMDVCRTATTSLALVDPARAAAFVTRNLLCALRAGEPHYLSIALANQAAFLASARNPKRSNKMMAEAESLAATISDPRVHGFLACVRALILYEQAHFAKTVTACDQAEQMLRGYCTGVAWELRTIQLFVTSSLFFLGEIRELERRVPAMITDARRRGDLYAITNMRAQIMPPLFLLKNDIASATRTLDETEREWTDSGFYLQHMFILFMRTFTDLYSGRGRAANERCDSKRKQLAATLLLEDRAVRTFWQWLCGTSALLAASQSNDARLLRKASRHARRLHRDGAAPYRGMAGLIAAGVASVRGQTERAVQRIDEAATAFDSAGMEMLAEVARRRRGVLMGGTAGGELIARADAILHDKGVVDPERVMDGFAPG